MLDATLEDSNNRTSALEWQTASKAVEIVINMSQLDGAECHLRMEEKDMSPT